VLPALTLLALTAALANADVLTYHNDNARTGQSLGESVLSPATVGQGTFGKLFHRLVDGFVYAQPLYVANVAIPGRGTHNVVYVATENDTVYAFDADSKAGPYLWKKRLIVPQSHGQAVHSNEVGCDDLVPKIGVTGTPVIDAGSGTLYVVAKTREGKSFVQRLHALDIATGAEKLGGPVVIAGAVSGNGDGSVGGIVTFDPLRENQRPSLLLVNGVVYIGWASYCDIGPYHGWVMGYDAATLQQVSVYNTTPDGGLGGVWQGGAGPAADAASNIYFETGNGTFDAQFGGNDLGDSLVKLGSDLTLADYFTPFNEDALSAADIDFGSSAPLLLPDQPGPHPHLAIASGKEGTIYLVDRDDKGHFHAGDDSQIVQSLPGAVGGTYGMPAYWNDTVYFLGAGDALKAFRLSGGMLSTSPASQASEVYGFPGATPTVSANGVGGAIVWTLQTDGYGSGKPAVLHAYDATDVSIELYNSNRAGRRHQPGKPVKFALPTVANGKVYVGAQKRISVFGLL
jgi:hypothetical protein